MSSCFYLVRHGLKQKAIGDVSLTLKGIRQAQATAKCFSKLPITAVISSPLRRAKETAHYIALETKTTLKVDSRLRERANWGDLPGQTFEQFVEMWNRCTREPDYLPPVGDSVRQASERLSSLLQDLIQESHLGGHIVLVTHGGLITDFLANTFSQNRLNEFHPNFIVEQSNLVPECSITKLKYAKGRFTIDSFASAQHLNEL